MDSRSKSKSDKSLCEESMKVVANVIRLSSLSIAQRTFGTATTGKVEKDFSRSDYSDMSPKKQRLVPHQTPESKRSREPQSRAKPTYMTNPVGNNRPPAHAIHKERVDEVKPKTEECVDGLASDYIRKIRNKFGCGL